LVTRAVPVTSTITVQLEDSTESDSTSYGDPDSGALLVALILNICLMHRLVNSAARPYGQPYYISEPKKFIVCTFCS